MSGPRRLVLASRNAAKVVELRRILAAAGLQIELVGLDGVPAYVEAPEVGVTFEENALTKARDATAATGLPAVADDSGLCVDAMNGMPGVLSARWSGRHGDDHANLALLLAQLADVPAERRGAQFVCAAAVVVPGGHEQVVTGVLAGRVITAPRGGDGFGYDPIFVPDGGTRTTAEMTPVNKDAISHRGRALAALVPVLGELLPS